MRGRGYEAVSSEAEGKRQVGSSPALGVAPNYSAQRICHSNHLLLTDRPHSLGRARARCRCRAAAAAVTAHKHTPTETGRPPRTGAHHARLPGRRGRGRKRGERGGRGRGRGGADAVGNRKAAGRALNRALTLKFVCSPLRLDLQILALDAMERCNKSTKHTNPKYQGKQQSLRYVESTSALRVGRCLGYQPR
jgi:hypothetical protein